MMYVVVMVDSALENSAAGSAKRSALRAFFEDNRFLLVFAVLASLMGTSVGMAQVTTSLYAVELGSSETLLGLIAASQSVGVIFMSLPVGVLADRLGPSRPFVFGTAVVGTIYASIPFGHSPLYLLACTALISFFMPFRFVSLNTLFLQQLAALGEAKAGWYRATHMVGMFLVGPMIGARAVSTLGFSGSYYMIALCFAATILVSPIVFARYSARPGEPRRLSWEALRGQVSLLVQEPELRRVSLVEGLTQATSAYFTFFIVVIGVSAARMNEQEASSLISAKGVSYIVALFALGGLLKSLGAARAYALCFGTIALGLSLLGSSDEPALLWIGALVVGLGLGSVQIATLTRYAQIGLRTGYGKVSGLNALVGPSGGVLGGLLGGSVGHWFGLQTVFLLGAGAFALAALQLLLAYRLSKADARVS
jgi:predicted MFS family arabinose efflux permease